MNPARSRTTPVARRPARQAVPNRLQHLLLGTTTAVLLAACGGGNPPEPGPAPAGPSAQAAPTARATAASTRQRPLATLSDGETALGLAASLLPYIEQQYAVHFPGTAPTQTWGPYVYRCYDNGNCVGFTAQDLYAMGPVVGNNTEPVWVGTVADYCNAQPLACGLKLQREVLIDGLVRHYIVHIPWAVRQRSDVPVVFMLHGTSGTGEEFYNHSGWREKADAEGLIAVFPTALRHCYYEDDNRDGDFDDPSERRTPTKWADSFLGHPTERPLCTAEQMATLPAEARAAADHPLADDVAFFRAMVGDVTANLGGDARRVYVSGFSNGAQMTLRLAHEASTLIAAAASNAGGASAQLNGPAARPMSMIFAVGDQDDRYNASAENPLPLTDAGQTDRMQRMTSPFLGVLSLAPTYTWQSATLYGRQMSIHTYATSTATPAGGNVFHAAVMQGIGHQYPNFMPDLLWNFFRDKSLP